MNRRTKQDRWDWAAYIGFCAVAACLAWAIASVALGPM